MSIPFVGPWEQSSISLLGTALMRPGILPFIPHSLQLGTAHSFRYGHSKVFVYTETMQLAKAAHSPLRSSVCAHAIPRIPAKTVLLRVEVFHSRCGCGRCVCACLLQLKWILCQRMPRKVICSWFADLVDMECITFPQFGEENQLMPTRSSFQAFLHKHAFMIATCLMILQKILRTTTQSPILPRHKGQLFAQIHFYLGLSSFFASLLSSDQWRGGAPAAQKPH